MMKITKNGQDLAPSLYTWDENIRTLSTNETGVVIDCVRDCTINCGNDCTIDCSHNCTIDCGKDCIIRCDDNCIIGCGSGCIIIRRDIFEVFFFKETTKIKINPLYVEGYQLIKNYEDMTKEE